MPKGMRNYYSRHPAEYQRKYAGRSKGMEQHRFWGKVPPRRREYGGAAIVLVLSIDLDAY